MPRAWVYYIWKNGRFKHIGEGGDAYRRWRKFKGKKQRELLSGPRTSPTIDAREIHNIGAPYKKKRRRRR